MADNIPAQEDPLKILATDEVAGVHFARTKLALGADGVHDGDVSDSNPMPVKLDAASLAALESITALGPLTDTQLRASAVPVSFTWAGLTDAQLRSAPVAVSLDAASLAALETITVGGAVAVSNLPATQAVSVAALPLPSGAAQDSTVAAMNADLGDIADSPATSDTGGFSLISLFKRLLQSFTTLVGRTPVNAAGVPIITTAREKFRDAFLTFDTTNNWVLEQQGVGMSAPTPAGLTGGSRYLNIASGTTINSETIIRSKTLFRCPASVIVGFSMSQRIANCDAFIELVECDSSGVPITDATIPSAVFKGARNGASFQFTGTVATTQTYNSRQDGVSEIVGTATLVTTIATGTGPNFLPAGLFEITLRNRDVQFTSLSVDSAISQKTGSSRTQRVPNPDALYCLRLRVKNGGTAPASSTDVRFHGISILDDARMSVDFVSAGLANNNNAPPVLVANTPSVIASAGTAAIGDVGSQYRANATGAASAVSVLSPATPAAATIKATAGRLVGYRLVNTSAALRSVKLFNVAAPTLGTTAAAFEIDIPAGGIAEDNYLGGIGFATAMTYSVTSAKGLTDNTATGLAANDVSGHFAFA